MPSRRRASPRGRESAASRLLPAAVLVWLGWIVAVHEWRGAAEFLSAWRALAVPVTAPSAAAFVALWATRAGSLALVLALQCGCLASGVVAVRFLLRREGRRRSGLRILPLGWLLTALACTAAAATGLAYPAVVILLTLVPLALPSMAAAAAQLLPRPIPPADARSRRLAACGAAAVAIACLVAQAADTSSDVLIYHYAKPMATLARHRLVASDWNLFAHLPSLWEMSLLAPLAAGGEPATRWLNPALLLYVGMATRRVAGRFVSPAWAWGAGALLMTNPFLVGQTVMAKNDLWVAALAIGAVEWCLPAPGAAVSTVAAGALAGAAFATKYTGGYVLPALAVGLGAAGRLTRRRFAGLAGGFAAVAAAGLLMTWIRTGDPVYPVGRVMGFASPWVSPGSAERLREMMYSVTRQDPGDISRWRNMESVYGGAGGEESLLRWAALLPVALCAAPLGAGLRLIWGALVAATAVWWLGPPQVRFASMLFPLGVVAAVVGLAGWNTLRVGRFRVDGTLLLGTALALQLFHLPVAGSIPTAGRAGLGLESPEGYRHRVLSSLDEAVRAVNRLVPADGRVVVHGEGRGARIHAAVELAALSGVAFPCFAVVHGARDTAEIWKRVRQRGWTHLLFNRVTAFVWMRTMADDPWTGHDLRLWAEFWRRHAVLAWESPVMDFDVGYFYLFRLVPHAARPHAAVLPGIEGWVWRLEQERAAGRTAAVAERFGILRAAAGDFGEVDLIEIAVFRDRLSPAAVEALATRARARGFVSPQAPASAR